MSAAPQARSLFSLFSPERATALDSGEADLSAVHEDLAAAGFYGQGVPVRFGGDGAPFLAAVKSLADLAGESLTAAFSAWCQRSCIHYLVHTRNAALREELLPGLLAGARAGATGLSNAMKHLAGVEDLRVQASLEDAHVTITGNLPWASNLIASGFDIAVAARASNGGVAVVLIPSEAEGLTRSADLPLCGLLGSATASIKLDAVRLPAARILSAEGTAFLSEVRPGFVLLQIALGLGLARRALESAAIDIPSKARILAERYSEAEFELEILWQQVEIIALSPDARGAGGLRQLFQVRVRAMRLAVLTAGLELEATGGAGYFRTSCTSRRLREAAFLPVLTPSLVQLETQLASTLG